MLPATPLPVLVVRLAADARPWRFPRDADIGFRLLNVPMSLRLGEPGLPYSFAASPGRYLADLVEMGAEQGWEGPVVVLNPGVQCDIEHMRAVLTELGDLSFGSAAWRAGECLILEDYSGRPLAYAFNSRWRPNAEQLHAVRFLSGRDASLDMDLLCAAGVPSQQRKVRTPPGLPLAEALPIFHGMESMAIHAARSYRDMLRAGARKTLAVVTHHAGDVLLTVQAIERCGRNIDGIIVHASYADVARAVQGTLPIYALEGPLPARGDVSSPLHPLNEEILYFEQVVAPSLPEGAAFLFLRPYRGYIEADHTLAAQVAYAVGTRGDEHLYPPAFTMEAPDVDTITSVRHRLPRVCGRRVLLHFDGGWPLKVYPREWQHELIELLCEAGFEPSVLGANIPGIPSHQFTNLAALNELMAEQDLLIGMDSFPCHYASQRLELPTVCLFASTRMENLAHAAKDYVAMEQGLSCSPCGQREVCPRFGGHACRNFVPPAIVTELALQCLQKP